MSKRSYHDVELHDNTPGRPVWKAPRHGSRETSRVRTATPYGSACIPAAYSNEGAPKPFVRQPIRLGEGLYTGHYNLSGELIISIPPATPPVCKASMMPEKAALAIERLYTGHPTSLMGEEFDAVAICAEEATLARHDSRTGMEDITNGYHAIKVVELAIEAIGQAGLHAEADFWSKRDALYALDKIAWAICAASNAISVALRRHFGSSCSLRGAMLTIIETMSPHDRQLLAVTRECSLYGSTVPLPTSLQYLVNQACLDEVTAGLSNIRRILQTSLPDLGQSTGL